MQTGYLYNSLLLFVPYLAQNFLLTDHEPYKHLKVFVYDIW